MKRMRRYASKRHATEMLQSLMDKSFDKGWDAGYREAMGEDEFAPQADFETLLGELESVIDDLKLAADRGDLQELRRLLAPIGLETRIQVSADQARFFWLQQNR